MSFKTAVLGASGYAGGELVKILDNHPEFELVHLGAHSRQGDLLGDVHPQLGGPQRALDSNDPAAVGEVDLAFLALPHGASAETGHVLRQRGVVVVDLGSDYRLDTESRYQQAYGTSHPRPDELPGWVYGLPELFDVKGASAIASPGCYPTSVLLAIAPLLAAGLVDKEGIVADCMSGVSGAGRTTRDDLMFGAVDEGVRAYAIGTHRHRPEIEMALDSRLGGEHRIVFTPHLVPMQRGLLATVTARRAGREADLRAAMEDFYVTSPLVDVIDRPPQTRWVVTSDRAVVAVFTDERTGSVIAQCAIDNLGKGAAGQAVQAANLALGVEEAAGLSLAGWMP